MAPNTAPCSEPRPPIMMVIRNSTDTMMPNCSGLMNASLWAYSAPASPVTVAEIANAVVLNCARLMPMLSAATSLSRSALSARPVRERSTFKMTSTTSQNVTADR